MGRPERRIPARTARNPRKTMLLNVALLALAAAAPAQEAKPSTEPPATTRPAATIKATPAATISQAPLAATGDQEKMRAQYQEKLKKEFFKNGPWLVDYDAARTEAKKSGKNLFIYFSRSYAP
jgi:Skp family chaperone for outer membrane proteins